MHGRVLVDDAENHPQQAVVAPAPPPAVGRAFEHGVPGEEVLTLRRELHAPDESPVPGNPERSRLAPLDRLVRTSRCRDCCAAGGQRHDDQGEAGQHHETLLGNALSTGALGEPPNCSTMFDTDSTFADVSRRKSHWSALTQPTRSHWPFCETTGVPTAPVAE